MGDGDGGSYKGQLRWIYPPPSRILSLPNKPSLATGILLVGGFSSILSDEYHSFLCTPEEIVCYFLVIFRREWLIPGTLVFRCEVLGLECWKSFGGFRWLKVWKKKKEKSPVVIPLCVHAQQKSWWNWSFFPFLGSKNGGLLLELKSCHFGRFDWPPFSETKRGGRGAHDGNQRVVVALSLTRHRKSPSPGLWCSTQIWGKLEDSEWYSHFCTKDEICHGVGPCHASLCISLLPSYCHSVRTELLTLLLFSPFYRQEMSKALS